MSGEQSLDTRDFNEARAYWWEARDTHLHSRFMYRLLCSETFGEMRV